MTKEHDGKNSIRGITTSQFNCYNHVKRLSLYSAGLFTVLAFSEMLIIEFGPCSNRSLFEEKYC